MKTGYLILLDYDGDDDTRVLTYPRPNYRQVLAEARKKVENAMNPRSTVSVARATHSSLRYKNKAYEVIRLTDEDRVFVSHSRSKKDKSSKNISHLEISDHQGLNNKEIVQRLVMQRAK